MSQMFGSALSLTSVGRQAGLTIVSTGTPLTRLHFYDGKFLRAADLELEQRYLQALVRLSNQAGGAGVVHGYSATLGSGDTLEIGEGLAIDPQGRVLLLPAAASVPIAELIGASARTSGPIPYGDDVITRPVSRPTLSHLGELPERLHVVDTAARGGAIRSLESAAALRAHTDTSLDRSSSPWVVTDAAARRPASGEFVECAPATSDGPNRVVEAPDLYLIVIAHAESLCGQEDVYGRLCEAACTTRSERPYYVEGIVVRAIPLDLNVVLGQVGPIVLTVRHLRSRVASAYFAKEAAQIATLINKDGLSGSAAETWCLGAEAFGGFGVPIGVLGRAGSITTFFDAWIARRERMEAPPRRYWAWRMSMRPWDIFLAQVLQFQCQLHELFIETPRPGATDPCREGRDLIGEASGALTNLREYYANVTGALARLRLPSDNEVFKIDTIKGRLGAYEQLLGRLDEAKKGVGLTDRVLIRGGILEVPSAGYLPVASKSTISVNEQVRTLLGDGVDLRFCVVRPDFVPHALEEAQHMERISLVEGLANPQARPHVDVLVPNGEPFETITKTTGMAFAGAVNLITAFVIDATSNSLAVTGAGRGEFLAGGGVAFHYAGVGQAPSASDFGMFVNGFDNLNEVRDRGAFGSIATTTPTVPAGVFRVGEAARRLAPNRASSFEGGVVRGTPEGIPGAILDQPTTRKVTALWATVRCDADPFSLQVGQQTTLNGRLVAVIPTSRVSLVDITASSPLRVSDVTPGSGVTDRCRGFVTLDVTWIGFAGTSRLERHYRLDATIELTRLDQSQGSIVTAKLGFARSSGVPVELAFTTSWSGTPLAVTCTGELGFGRGSGKVLDAALKENAGVLNAGNTEHDLAITALEVIDAVLAEPAFKAHAEQLLFPPASPAEREQALRATLDWVLFHRRREKDCGVRETVPAPAVKNRRYKVYTVQVKVPDHATPLVEALRQNKQAVLQRAQFVPAGVVEFGSGSPNLLTPSTTLVDQWQHTGHGNRILHAAMANTGEATGDGEPLSMARVKQLELGLNPVGMTLDPSATSELLSTVPEPTLPADDTDGVITIITYSFIDIRRARVVLYRPEGPSAFIRIANGPTSLGAPAASALPDLTLLFHDSVLQEDGDAAEVLRILHALTGSLRVPVNADRLDVAMREAPDANAQKRADSVAAFLRRTQVQTVAGLNYFLLKPTASVGTRRLREARPDERPFLEEAGRPVAELIALVFGD